MNEIVKAAQNPSLLKSVGSILGWFSGVTPVTRGVGNIAKILHTPFNKNIKGFLPKVTNVAKEVGKLGLNAGFTYISIPSLMYLDPEKRVKKWFDNYEQGEVGKVKRENEKLKWGAIGAAGGMAIGHSIDPKYTIAGAALGGAAGYFGKDYINR